MNSLGGGKWAEVEGRSCANHERSEGRVREREQDGPNADLVF